MQLSHIRAQARQKLKDVKGSYLLFTIPLILYFVTLFSEMFTRGINAAATSVDDPGFTALSGLVSIFNSSFILVLGVIASIAITAIATTTLKMVRNQVTTVSFKDSLIGYKSDRIGKIFLTNFIKGIYLFLFGFIFSIGIILFFGAIIFFFIAIITIKEEGAASYSQYGYVFSDLGDLISVSFNDALPNIFTNGGIDAEAFILAVPALSTIAFVASLPTMLVGAIIYLPAFYAYRLSDYVLADQLELGNYTGPTAVLKESRTIIKGSRMKLFLLDLSFIGWFLLPIFTLGLGYIYFYPYYTLANAAFYKELKAPSQQV